MKPTTTNILERTAECFTTARESIFEGIAGLYEISEKELWKEGGYGTFGEYAEQVCQLHPSAASRYLKVYRHYIQSGSFSIAQLAPVDPERLYIALGTKGGIEEQYERAANLTRSELRAEAAVKDDGSEHDCVPKQVTFCEVCNRRMS